MEECTNHPTKCLVILTMCVDQERIRRFSASERRENGKCKDRSTEGKRSSKKG